MSIDIVTTDENGVETKAKHNVIVKRLTLRLSRKLAGAIKDVIAQIEIISSSGSTLTLPTLIESVIDSAEDFLPLITNLDKNKCLDLDFDQLHCLFDEFKEKNKSFLSMLGSLGLSLDPTATTDNEAQPNQAQEIKPPSAENLRPHRQA